MNNKAIKEKTISDFGDQWTHFQDNPGYYGSVGMLKDIFGNLIEVENLNNKRVAEIGSGSGRIVNMLAEMQVSHITALEPSEAFTVLKKNTSINKGRIRFVKKSGEHLPIDNYDYIFSIGVIHHIVDPKPVIDNAFNSLKKDGKLFIWVYAKEGNRLYLSVAKLIRMITPKIPDWTLRIITHFLTVALAIYVFFCRFIKLPMSLYMRNVLGKYGYNTLWLTVFDQLNPAYSKYYTREEAFDLMRKSGFADIRLFHRHGYSWSVIGTKK